MAAVYNKIIQYIDHNIKEDISISDIANVVGYSANHIYKLFKLYSPYPIMEYVRRMKMNHAANEIYKGRKLLDIALDYGYGSPAGFYKAFKNIFGCSPRDFQKNIMKEGVSMLIDNIKNTEELDAALTFANKLHPNFNFDFGGEGDGKYSRQFWIEQWKKNPSLLLAAKENAQIYGIILGWIEGNYVTAAIDGIAENCQNKGVHEALFVEMEKRTKELGLNGISLGINEGKEEFYAKMGYIGKTLIQSEKYSVNELKAFNEKYKSYEVAGSGVYEDYVNQLWLNASLLDKGLKKRFEEEIGDCWVIIVVSKEL